MSKAATVIILRYLMFVLSFSGHVEDILDNKPDDDIYIMMKCVCVCNEKLALPPGSLL